MLLFDEPDAHLHPSLQRCLAKFLQEPRENPKQILLATHAPDLIEELPVESLVWIDRLETEGRRSDSVGKALVDLGAISAFQAAALAGACSILFFEDKDDREALSEILRRCGKTDLLSKSRLERLRGYGDADKLSGVTAILRELIKAKVAVAAILDADYTTTTSEGSATVDGSALIIRLPCKELENLLLLSPRTIAAAAREEAEKRGDYLGTPVPSPSEEEIARRIDELTLAKDIEDQARGHWIHRWSRENNVNLNNAGELARGGKLFTEHWKDAEWRRRFCPGKVVLKLLKEWLQKEYSLSFGVRTLFRNYEPDERIRGLFDKLEAHVKEHLG